LPIEQLSRSRKTLVRSLHRRKGRVEEGAYLAEGERLLGELAKSPRGLRFVFATEDYAGRLARMFPGVECCVVDGDGGDLFATENAQGVGAVVDIPLPTSLADLAAAGAPVIYLDGIADPGNAGTILRTAEWFGVAGVAFGTGSVDPYNPKVVRASMGAIFHAPIAADVSPADIAACAAGLGVPVIALEAGGTELLGEIVLPRRAIYVVGSEAHGISAEIRANARPVAIGGLGSVESLNAAIAAAILLYEIFRPTPSSPRTVSQ